jgi:energy-coupling factor transport system ATP-binding protein
MTGAAPGTGSVGFPAVVLRGVGFVYPTGPVVALDDVSLEIARGEVVAIAGQNGSGKTTLTKLLNGLLQPTTGSVEVDGVDTSGRRVQELARHVGYVFQNPSHQLFARTVEEELAFGPRNLGLDSDEVDRRVAEVTASFGLDGVLREHPYRLGAPMRKLVTIASVVAMRSPILVLDEPTTGQDHRTIDRIAGIIGELRAGGTTVVCVTHDMEFAASVADRIVALAEGRIVTEGPPRSVFGDAESMAAARLVPPQIARLSLVLAGDAGRGAALSVAELVAQLGGPRADVARMP